MSETAQAVKRAYENTVRRLDFMRHFTRNLARRAGMGAATLRRIDAHFDALDEAASDMEAVALVYTDPLHALHTLQFRPEAFGGLDPVPALPAQWWEMPSVYPDQPASVC